MATAQRVRTHATAHRLHRFNQYISKCTELDAIISVAQEVKWLATQPGRIVVADKSGQMLCKVWNAKHWDSASFIEPDSLLNDGPAIHQPIVKHVGHYVIESVRPLNMEVRSHFLTVEAPE